MSDSDSDDGFDEEAERERLREQLEGDRAKRKETQRMSDLLLRGATMTNRHCDVCGDPIFRYEGEEFCPSCQGTTDGAADVDDHPADESDMVASGDGGENGESPSPSASADRTADPGRPAESDRTAEPDQTPNTTEAEEASRTDERERPNRSPADATVGAAGGAPTEQSIGDPRRSASNRSPSERRPAASSPAPEPPDSDSSVDDRTAARRSLERTLASLARRAEETNDPRQARELLAAAREAAETLSALDR